jgi:hypothetical protein
MARALERQRRGSAESGVLFVPRKVSAVAAAFGDAKSTRGEE